MISKRPPLPEPAATLVPVLPTQNGLITREDILHEQVTPFGCKTGDDFHARRCWKMFRETLDATNQLIDDVRTYPLSEPFETSEDYSPEGEYIGSYAMEPSSALKNRSRTVHAMFAIQELASAYEIFKDLQDSLHKDTLENLIYSLGIAFSLDVAPDSSCLDNCEPWEVRNYGDAEQTRPMADGYQRIFSFLNKDKSLELLCHLFEDIHQYAAQAYRLLHVMSADTSRRMRYTRKSITAKHKDARLIIMLLNERIAEVLSRKEKLVRKQIATGLRCGDFAIEDKLKDCYIRLRDTGLYKQMGADYDETPEGFAAFLTSYMASHSGQSYEEDYDGIWEFLSCIIELELLRSIKAGTPMPKPFFPIPAAEEEPADKAESKAKAVRTAKNKNVFESQEARKFWGRLRDAGYVDAANKLTFNIEEKKLNKAAYIALRFNEVLRPDVKSNQWAYFEELWNIKKHRLRNAECVKRDGCPPREAAEIDNCFLKE